MTKMIDSLEYLRHRIFLIDITMIFGSLIHHIVFPIMGLCSRLFGLGMLGYFVYASTK